jgi:hypothetical protein
MSTPKMPVAGTALVVRFQFEPRWRTLVRLALPHPRPRGQRDDARELGEDFEEREHVVLGEHAFEGAVADVTKLEVALGIGDLETFTT